jgi:hypothetical protein
MNGLKCFILKLLVYFGLLSKFEGWLGRVVVTTKIEPETPYEDNKIKPKSTTNLKTRQGNKVNG